MLRRSTTTPRWLYSESVTDARLDHLAPTLVGRGRASTSTSPTAAFYLWFHVGDAWAFAERLATEGGALVSPGDFYGEAGREFVRVAAVQPDAQITTLASRLEGRE